MNSDQQKNTGHDSVKKSAALPRKVVIATVMWNFNGSVETRLADAGRLIDAAAREAQAKYHGRGLDLVVFPEQAIQSGDRQSARERAVPLTGPVLETMAAKARTYRTNLIIPMILPEGEKLDRFSNVAVLLDRAGRVTGIYRKVFPVAAPDGVLEGDITPGSEFPVFDCDFGRLGIQICWDMSYEEGWLALARHGAELVAVPSASPQTIRPSCYALRGQYYVVTSTPCDNASIFNPIGLTVAQTTSAPVLVQEIDLAYAILHWTPQLDEGRSLTKRFGNRVGCLYSARENTGVFWSNDPGKTIGAMAAELQLPELGAQIEDCRRRQDSARGGPPLVRAESSQRNKFVNRKTNQTNPKETR